MTEVGRPPRASTPAVPPPSINEFFTMDFTHKYLRNFQKSVESLFQVPKSFNKIMYEYESQKHLYKILNISKIALVTNVSSKKRAMSKAVDHVTLQKFYDNKIKVLNAELKKAKSREKPSCWIPIPQQENPGDFSCSRNDQKVVFC
jgi:hypothetical protein